MKENFDVFCLSVARLGKYFAIAGNINSVVSMRAFVLLLPLLSICCASFAQESKDKKNDWVAEDLRGKVQSVTIRGFRAEGGIQGSVLKGSLIHTTVKKYNNSGYLLESTSSIGGNKIGTYTMPFRSARIAYKYDKYNNLLSSCSYNTQGRLEDSSVHEVDKLGNRIIWKIFKGDGTQEWEYVSEYDNAGNLLEVNDYHWSKLISRHTYRYNDDSKCTMEGEYEPDGRLKMKKMNKYDEKGNKMETIDFNGSGNFNARHTYGYNDWGNVIEEREYKEDGSDRHTKILREFDNQDHVIELRQFDENGKLIYLGKFDKYDNHLADITYGPDGSVREKVTAEYKYDAYGNETEELLKLAERVPATKSVYKYEYDYMGNWIKKTVFEDGDPVRMTERDLVYYE